MYSLVVSNMRRMVPATQALSRRTMNSKPSLDTRVTNSGGWLGMEASVVA